MVILKDSKEIVSYLIGVATRPPDPLPLLNITSGKSVFLYRRIVPGSFFVADRDIALRFRAQDVSGRRVDYFYYKLTHGGELIRNVEIATLSAHGEEVCFITPHNLITTVEVVTTDPSFLLLKELSAKGGELAGNEGGSNLSIKGGEGKIGYGKTVSSHTRTRDWLLYLN